MVWLVELLDEIQDNIARVLCQSVGVAVASEGCIPDTTWMKCHKK